MILGRVSIACAPLALVRLAFSFGRGLQIRHGYAVRSPSNHLLQGGATVDKITDWGGGILGKLAAGTLGEKRSMEALQLGLRSPGTTESGSIGIREWRLTGYS